MPVQMELKRIIISEAIDHQTILLKEVEGDRIFPIIIGIFEATSIDRRVKKMPSPRPLTHDLLKSMISQLGAEVVQVVINELRNDVYYARIVLDQNGRRLEVDSRPSDAIALAVRVHVPIYVDESVMEKAGGTPEEEVDGEPTSTETPDERLSIFKDFVDTLDLDDLDDNE